MFDYDSFMFLMCTIMYAGCGIEGDQLIANCSGQHSEQYFGRDKGSSLCLTKPMPMLFVNPRTLIHKGYNPENPPQT